MPDCKIVCQCSYGRCEFHIDDEEVWPDEFIKKFNRNGCPGEVDHCHVIRCEEPRWKYDSEGLRITERTDIEEKPFWEGK